MKIDDEYTQKCVKIISYILLLGTRQLKNATKRTLCSTAKITTNLIFILTFNFTICAFSSCSISNQKQFIKKQIKVESEYTIISYSFKNELLQKNITGHLYSLIKKDSVEFVMVKWANGNYSIGEMQNNKLFGKWYTFDKRNRLRSTLAFLDPETLLFINRFNKKGEIIYHSENTVPF